MDFTTLSDLQLWNLIRKGDRSAFAILYQRHIKSLYNYGLRISSDRGLIQDSLQELFIEFWNKKEKLSEVKQVKIYLIKSFRYKLLRAISQSQKLNQISIEDLLVEIPGIEKSKNEVLQKRKNLLKEILKEMPEKQRTVIHLKYYQRLSNSEIAEILNVNYQSVSNLLHRALNKLKKSLSEKKF